MQALLSPTYLKVGKSTEIKTDILNSYKKIFDFHSYRMTSKKDKGNCSVNSTFVHVWAINAIFYFDLMCYSESFKCSLWIHFSLRIDPKQFTACTTVNIICYRQIGRGCWIWSWSSIVLFLCPVRTINSLKVVLTWSERCLKVIPSNLSVVK